MAHAKRLKQRDVTHCHTHLDNNNTSLAFLLFFSLPFFSLFIRQNLLPLCTTKWTWNTHTEKTLNETFTLFLSRIYFSLISFSHGTKKSQKNKNHPHTRQTHTDNTHTIFLYTHTRSQPTSRTPSPLSHTSIHPSIHPPPFTLPNPSLRVCVSGCECISLSLLLLHLPLPPSLTPPDTHP